jgi:hypothetical protein
MIQSLFFANLEIGSAAAKLNAFKENMNCYSQKMKPSAADGVNYSTMYK